MAENENKDRAERINEMILKAKAKAAAKAEEKTGAAPKAPKQDDESKAQKAAERAKAREEAEAKRNAKKEERERNRVAAEAERARKKAERELKKAEKAAQVKEERTPHLAKVQKAGAALPELGEGANQVYTTILAQNLSRTDMNVLIAHLQHHARLQSTLASLGTNLHEGQEVRIVSCDRDPRLIGCTGTISQVRKIRVLVDVGRDNDVYLFSSDVEPTEAVQEETTTEEAAPEEAADFLKVENG